MVTTCWPQGAVSGPGRTVEPQRKKRDSRSAIARLSQHKPMKSHGSLLTTALPTSSFPLPKSSPARVVWGPCHSCRPWIAIFCWLFFFCWFPVCVPVCVLVAQLCPILPPHGLCSLPGSSGHGILQGRILEWVAIPFSRGSSQPRDRTQVSCTAGRFLPSEPPGKPLLILSHSIFAGKTTVSLLALGQQRFQTIVFIPQTFTWAFLSFPTKGPIRLRSEQKGRLEAMAKEGSTLQSTAQYLLSSVRQKDPSRPTADTSPSLCEPHWQLSFAPCWFFVVTAEESRKNKEVYHY